MDKKKLHQTLEHNINFLMSDKDRPSPSMRYLSSCIGASEGYIQKILNSDHFPSIEKLLLIAEHYEIEPWMLLYNHKNKEMLSILKELEQCPVELFPAILAYIDFVMQASSTLTLENSTK